MVRLRAFTVLHYAMLFHITTAFVKPTRSPFLVRQLAASSRLTRLASTTTEKAVPVVPAHYPFAEVEKKWQNYWDKNETFKTPVRNPDKPKKYVLDMFPYPSGAGLHVGHPEGYTGMDTIFFFPICFWRMVFLYL